MSPTPVKILEITKDTPQFETRFEELVQVVSKAFATDPLTQSGLGFPYEANPKLHDEFSRMQLLASFTGAGRVFAAVTDAGGSERAIGAAIWYGPGRGFLDNEEQVVYWNSFLGTLSPDIQTWWLDVMTPRYDQLTKEGLGDGVKKDSLHLRVLGALPEYHRRGVGRKLVAHAFDQDEFRGVASCLETCKETNLLFYNSLGYQVKLKTAMPSAHGDFTMWCLHREPRV